MSALKKYIFVFFLSSTFARIQYIDILIGASCINKANERGVCEFYQNCHLIEKVKNKQIKLEDIFECNRQGIICCTPEASISTTTHANVINSDSPFAPHDIIKERVSEKKCKEYSQSTKTITLVAPTRINPEPIETIVDKCQHKSAQLVVGGKNAHRFEFPHQALLGYIRDYSYEWVCGGSLISPQFVLTAAHCRYNEVVESEKSKVYNITTVKLGMISLTEVDQDTRNYRVAEFIVHKNFKSLTKHSDIALIRLARTVQLSEKVHPICLPTREYDDIKAIVSGFGRTDGRYNHMSKYLMKAVLEKYNETECQNSYSGVKIDSATMMCFGNSSHVVDSCNGDSGGPLQIEHENVYCSYTQIGIVSFGNENCDIEGFPGVYVNVFHFIDWIESIVWPDE